MLNLRTMTAAAVGLCVAFIAAGCSQGGSSPATSATDSTKATAELSGRLFFTQTTQSHAQTIFVSDAHGNHKVTKPGDACCLLRKSPADERLLVMPGADTPPPVTGATVMIDSGKVKRLARTDPTLNLVPQAWSPDGSRIAYEGWDDSDPSRTGVYTARATDGGDLVQVVSRPGSIHDIPLDFSPDGTQLVFYKSVNDASDNSYTGGSLWVVRVNGADARQITTADSPPANWARWSPDGTRILFAAERLSPAGPLWTVAPDGTGFTTIFKDKGGGFAIAPDWSGTDLRSRLRLTQAMMNSPSRRTVWSSSPQGARICVS